MRRSPSLMGLRQTMQSVRRLSGSRRSMRLTWSSTIATGDLPFGSDATDITRCLPTGRRVL